MNDRMPLPVFVLTGFLGSGKTVLLNSFLRDPAFADSAVVVNEFGEIGLDHLLIAEARDNIVLLDAGCLCCAILDSLKETLADLYQRRARGEIPPFQRVLVETSGLADPAPILQSLMRDPIVSHFYRLAGLICTADAIFGLDQLEAQSEARAQIALADRLIVTKTDLTGGVIPEPLRTRIRQLNPAAEIVAVSHGQIDAARLLNTRGDGVDAPWLDQTRANEAHHHDHSGHDHAGHDHSHVRNPNLPTADHDPEVTSESFWLDGPVTWSGLAAWIDVMKRRYGRDLLRCKGILRVQGCDGPVVLHGVQTLFDTMRRPDWPDDIRRSRLVLIGRGLDRAELTAFLGWLHAPEGVMPPGRINETPPADAAGTRGL